MIHTDISYCKVLGDHLPAFMKRDVLKTVLLPVFAWYYYKLWQHHLDEVLVCRQEAILAVSLLSKYND